MNDSNLSVPSRVVLVSDRLPVHARAADGAVELKASVGGERGMVPVYLASGTDLRARSGREQVA